MASDRARVTFDASRQWRGLVAQQGRVTLEADWNEAATIDAERDRLTTLDTVGPFGSPNGRGYLVAAVPATGGPPSLVPGDVIVGAGIIYVGGLRLELLSPVAYSAQPDWLDCSTDVLWQAPAVPEGATDVFELVYLLAYEQEVGAVEDTVLADVALGGPDTMQRRRILQHVVRQTASAAITTENWSSALASQPELAGLISDPTSMMLESTSRLQVSFPDMSSGSSTCQPVTTGGYLGAENQMLRVRVSGVVDGTPSIVWGFDDASSLYRVVSANYDPANSTTTLVLATAPVDSYHFPASGQVVELLRSSVQLTSTDFIASSTGFVSPLATGYDPTAMTVVLAGEPPADYLFLTASGTVPVAVTTPDGTSPDLPSAQFTYGPAVTGVSPSAGPLDGGTVVTVTGSGFTGATEVDFGASPGGGVTVDSDSQLTVTAPPAGTPGPVDVLVVTPGGTSPVARGAQFAYGLAVTSVTPSNGAVGGSAGTVVTLTGIGFTGATEVTFENVPGASDGQVAGTALVVGSDTQLQVTSPVASEAGMVSVMVTTPAGTSAPGAIFTFGPTVTSVSPAGGPVAGGTAVTLTGSGFTGASAVTFTTIPETPGGTPTTVTVDVGASNVLSDSQLQVTTPPAGGAGSVAVAVVSPLGTTPPSPGGEFVYGPSVSSVSPPSGPVAGGTAVTLIGNGFTGAREVSFGTVTVNLSDPNVSDTVVTVTAPPTPSGGMVPVTVTTPAGTSPASSAAQFTYGPLVTGVSPADGQVDGGTDVTITGSGFTGATEVTFGAQSAADLVVVSDTQITVTAPAAPIPQQLYLRVWQDEVLAPAGQATMLGSTGAAVTLTTTNGSVHPGDFWHFALRPLQPAIVYPPRYLAAPQPPDGPRMWACPLAALTWTGGNVTASTLVPPFWSLVELTSSVLAWLAIPPAAVEGLSPAIGPMAGGTQIMVAGSGFTGASSAHFGNVAGTGLWVVSDTQLRVTSPPGSGTVDVTVTTPKGSSPVVTADQFAYLEVTGISPASAPAVGGTTVTVRGSGFTGATSVQFGTAAVPLTPPDVVSDGEITVTVPAGSGTVDVTVTTPLGTSPTTPADQFTYGPTVTGVSPSAGPSNGGTQVTVTGTGFTGATAVSFGSASARMEAVVSDSQVTAISPPGGGVVNVTVTTPDGTSPVTPAGTFTYRKVLKEGKEIVKDVKEKEVKEKEKEGKEVKEAKEREKVTDKISDIKTTDVKTTDVKTHDVKVTDVKTTDVKTTDVKVTDRPPVAFGDVDAAEGQSDSPADQDDAPAGRSFITPEERPDVGSVTADEDEVLDENDEDDEEGDS
jgi:hypothetical protein